MDEGADGGIDVLLVSVVFNLCFVSCVLRLTNVFVQLLKIYKLKGLILWNDFRCDLLHYNIFP